MDSLIFAFEAVTPIILMVAIGYLIKRIGFLTADMAKIINKLVFRIFLPSMLFLNVYKIDSLAALEFDYILYAVIAIILIFSLSVLVVMKITPQGDRRGALLQACFRSNYALIGIPLAASLFGQEGVAVATLLSAASIPLFNVLAVVSLSIFGRGNQKPSGKKILSGIAKNPLIQSILLGLLILGEHEHAGGVPVKPVEDEDHCYYRVYRGAAPDFRPSPENQIASTVETSLDFDARYLDDAAILNVRGDYYKVLSVDRSGNGLKWDFN